MSLRAFLIILLLPIAACPMDLRSTANRVKACIFSFTGRSVGGSGVERKGEDADVQFLISLVKKLDPDEADYQALKKHLDQKKFTPAQLEELVATSLLISTNSMNYVFRIILAYQLNVFESPRIRKVLETVPQERQNVLVWNHVIEKQKELREEGNYTISAAAYLYTNARGSFASRIQDSFRLVEDPEGGPPRFEIDEDHQEAPLVIMIDRAKEGLMHMTWTELQTLLASGHGIDNPGGHLANAAIELSLLGDLNTDLALRRLNLILEAGGQIEWTRRLDRILSGMPPSPLKDRVNALKSGR